MGGLSLSKKDTNPKDVIGSGKVPLGLCPDTLDVATSMAFLEGALKYGRYNWRIAGVRASIYRDAGRRHFDAWWNGQDIDPKSGLHHLWKLAACIAILVDSIEIGNMVDDRPPRVNMDNMYDRMEPLVGELKQRYDDPDVYQYTIFDTLEDDSSIARGRNDVGPV